MSLASTTRADAGSGPLDEIDPDAWDRVIDVNLRGPAVTTRAALPQLRASGRGHIINITSTAAKRAWPNASAYHASKWGLLGFSHAMHAEARAYGVKVTAVVCGGMRTPFLLDRFRDLDPGLRLLGEAGFRFVVVTNQSGVARGYFTEADLDAVARHLAAELAAHGASLHGFYFCPHLPDGINEYAIECDCRKPEPGLIHRASRELGLPVEGSWFVGDTWMD